MTAARAAGRAPGRRVVVSVLTYLRPHDLVEVLPELVRQAATVSPPVEVHVVDNDPAGGAFEVVAGHGPSVRYHHEPEPGIAAARNRALDEAAHADVLVFVDDDERPTATWLAQLLATFDAHPEAAAVVGPVTSEFDVPPGPWVTAGRFFDRRRPATGEVVDVAATNNLLLDLHVIRRLGLRFDPGFGTSGGSDTLFTRQLDASGARMVWCAEAMVVDRVPAERVRPAWVLRRAHRGGNSWSRTSLLLAAPHRRPLVRAALVASGVARVLLGALRAAAGTLTRSRSAQARGVRLVARGSGMVTGALGVSFHEYRRHGGAPPAAEARS